MFRNVVLPKDAVTGRLLLHSMPGRFETWEYFSTEAKKYDIDTIVCLTPLEEVKTKSPPYAKAISEGSLEFSMKCYEIPDYGIPQNRDEFFDFVMHIAGLLQSGHRILVHCGAGIGRTGTFAICLLLTLGINSSEAEKIISEAGAGPETSEQIELIDWCDKKINAI